MSTPSPEPLPGPSHNETPPPPLSPTEAGGVVLSRAEWETLALPPSLERLSTFLEGLTTFAATTVAPGGVGQEASRFAGQVSSGLTHILTGSSAAMSARASGWRTAASEVNALAGSLSLASPTPLPRILAGPLALPPEPEATEVFWQTPVASPLAPNVPQNVPSTQAISSSQSIFSGLPAGAVADFLRWLEGWNDTRTVVEQRRVNTLYEVYTPPAPAALPQTPAPPSSVSPTPPSTAKEPDLLSRAWHSARTEPAPIPAAVAVPVAGASTLAATATPSAAAVVAGANVAKTTGSATETHPPAHERDDETAADAKGKTETGRKTASANRDKDGKESRTETGDNALSPRLSLEVVNRALLKLDSYGLAMLSGVLMGRQGAERDFAALAGGGATPLPFPHSSPSPVFSGLSVQNVPLSPWSGGGHTETGVGAAMAPDAFYEEHIGGRNLVPGRPAIPTASWLGVAPSSPTVPPEQEVPDSAFRPFPGAEEDDPEGDLPANTPAWMRQWVSPSRRALPTLPNSNEGAGINSYDGFQPVAPYADQGQETTDGGLSPSSLPFGLRPETAAALSGWRNVSPANYGDRESGAATGEEGTFAGANFAESVESVAGARQLLSVSPRTLWTNGPAFAANGFGGFAGENAAAADTLDGGTPAPKGTRRRPVPATQMLDPRLGQLTLIAPPLNIATEQAEQSGAAVRMDWQTLARGAGSLDAGGLAHLAAMLPPGARALYPALPLGAGGPDAVNLTLEPNLLQNLMETGYGPGMAGLAAEASARAMGAGGGTPAAAPLAAKLVPGVKRPVGTMGGGLLGTGPNGGEAPQDGTGALAEAGGASATRGGALDFMGLPVRLAPSLGGRSELRQEQEARSVGVGGMTPQTVRPGQFAPLRQRLFSSFQSVTTEPEKEMWRQAAPSFGLRNADPTTLLSPDAKAPVLSETAPLPQSDRLTTASTPAPVWAGRDDGMPMSLPPTAGGMESRGATGYGSLPLPGMLPEPWLPGNLMGGATQTYPASPLSSAWASALPSAMPSSYGVPSLPGPIGQGGWGAMQFATDLLQGRSGGGMATGAMPALPYSVPAGLPSGGQLPGLGAPSSVPSLAPWIASAIQTPAAFGSYQGHTSPKAEAPASITGSPMPGAPAAAAGRWASSPSYHGQEASFPTGHFAESAYSAPPSAFPGSLIPSARQSGPSGDGFIPDVRPATPSPSLSRPALPTVTGTNASRSPARSLPAVNGNTVPPPASSADWPLLGDGLPSALPALPSAPVPPPASGSYRVRPTMGAMPLPRAAAVPSTHSRFAVQRSERGAATAAAGKVASGSGATAGKAPGAAKGAAPAAEVNLLANEVYGLLKRRLQAEAERRGRW